MSKAAHKHEEKSEETLPVAASGNALVITGMTLDDIAADAGAGQQNMKATDLATPIISILQSNSPQCKRSDGKHIEGAVEGMLYNNVSNEVYDGEKGIKVIPCFFEKLYIEWKPSRGGLVALHPDTTPLKDQVKMVPSAEDPNKMVPTLPNGNNLIETNQHYVLIMKDDGTLEPAVISMASSALKASRLWNTLVKRVQLQDSKKNFFNPASYYMTYVLKTVARTKDKYSWFTWAIESAGPVPNKAVYDAGKSLEQAVKGGTVRVKHEQVDSEPAGAAPVEEANIPF